MDQEVYVARTVKKQSKLMKKIKITSKQKKMLESTTNIKMVLSESEFSTLR